MSRRDGSNRHVFDDSQPITPIFEEGEIVALWRGDRAVFAEFLNSDNGINWRNNQRIERSIVLVPPGGTMKTVQTRALAKLTELQQQDYVMAKLEDRIDMKIQEK